MAALNSVTDLFARWRRDRRVRRHAIAFAAWDLRERYGGAAEIIARSTALRRVVPSERRFWRRVRTSLARQGIAADRP